MTRQKDGDALSFEKRNLVTGGTGVAPTPRNQNESSLALPTGIAKSWISRNVLAPILRLAQERKELRIVADQIGAPTPAIAETVATMISGGPCNFAGHARKAQGLLYLPARAVDLARFCERRSSKGFGRVASNDGRRAYSNHEGGLPASRHYDRAT
jgi:hypothetical protein